jgi:exopolysaccharide biosynthesis polyprenyl glycosylphosphotransferase
MTLRFKAYRFYFGCWFYLLPALSFCSAKYLHFEPSWLGISHSPRDLGFLVVVCVLTTLLWAIFVQHYQLNSIEELLRENTGAIKTFSAVSATYLLMVGLLFFYREQNLSRSFFVFSAVVLFMSTLVSRQIGRSLLRRRYGAATRVKVLMVGTDAFAVEVAAHLSKMPVVPSEIVGHVRLPLQEVSVKDVPVFELEDVTKGMQVEFQDIVIATSPWMSESVRDLVRQLEGLCVPIRLVFNLGDIPVIRDRLFQLGDLQMLDVSTYPLESPYYFVLKRGFDIVFSLLAIILLSPALVAITLAIKLSSRGPVLFAQERVGLNGLPFRMYKFRTMRVAVSSESDTRWTTSNDDRRTAVGKLLRGSSLDELPQFLNVLKGEMSVVGPRPERPYFVKKFLDELKHYNSRHRLKVGITGWAQVNGWRGDTCIKNRLDCDLYYLQNWSFWLDLKIVWLTVWTGLFGRNAY